LRVLFLSILAYAGVAFIVLGLLAMIRPMRWLGFPSRARGLVAVVIGLVLLATGCLWPTPVMRATGAAAIDEAMPEYHFAERHERVVSADPAEIFPALRQVTAREIRFFRFLTWLRNPSLYDREPSILAPPADTPILDVALASGFRLISERPSSELVIEARVAPRVRAVMNFLVVPEGQRRSRLSTETRVFADDAESLRAFAIYWRFIYPGSSLIRTEWLQAIDRRVVLQLPGR